jgi:eukaryotic-like serine/threonine-protein kinase
VPEGLEVTGPIAISRDGEQIAFAAVDTGGEAHIYLRRLSDFEPKQVEGSRRGSVPFFSPDGSALGFFARGAIWRAATAGGPPTQLRAASSLVGADWMMDDTIVYSAGVGFALQRMSADGAVLEPITTLGKGEYAHVWPQRIPGTDQLLFTLWRGGGASWGGAQMLDIKTGAIHALSGKPDVASPPARWSASGHLILENGLNGLFAYPFDPSQDQSAPLAGANFLLGGVDGTLQGTRAFFALSDTGVIAYVPAALADQRLVHIQADGPAETILEQGPLVSTLLNGPISVTRDGRQALIGEGNILLVDLARKLPRPLTSDSSNKVGATFSPDEREVYYRSNREERWKVWKVPIDGSAPPTVAAQHALSINDGTSIGPGGEIVFSVRDPATQADIWLQDASGTQRALIATQASEASPALSPDGATLAYLSDASGSNEVYLIAASGKGVPVQVTDGGGNAPKWSLDGRALLYSKGRHIFQIAVKDGQPVGDAIQRFAVDNLLGGSSFALAPDGNSLYAVQLGKGAIPREIRVITDFFDEIERVTKAKNNP